MNNEDLTLSRDDLKTLSQEIHQANTEAGWWSNKDTGQCIKATRNRSELLMLTVSEIGEASEGVEGNLMDDKLPHRKMVEVELADVVIRLLDQIGAETFDFDIVPNFEEDFDTYPYYADMNDGFMNIIRSLSFAMEGHRKGNKDKYKQGLIEAVYKTYWMCASFGLDLTGAIREKRAFNSVREDHKLENRLKPGGKAY